MSIDTITLIGLGFFLGTLVVLQIYFAYRIQKNKLQTEQEPSKPAPSHLSPKGTFRLGLFYTVFYGYVILWALYFIRIGKISLPLGAVFIIVSLWFIRKPINMIRDHRPVHDEQSIRLPLLSISTNGITPEFILEILGDESVLNAIRIDLEKTRQIGAKEQWRLGLLTPDIDTFDLSLNELSRQERLSRSFDATTMANFSNQIPIKRAAILHSTSYFAQFNNVLVIHGTQKPMIRSYPGWHYGLSTKTPREGYTDIRELEIDTDSLSTRHRSRSLPKFLQEDGFPLKDTYLDGDPLTTERGGTIVIDKGKVKIIYPDYFVQGRLIDDEGNLVYMGLDENFQHSSSWKGVSVVPSLSRKLYKCVEYNEYVPIVRYRSFPYASDFMLPILDTPLSDSGWADLFINTRGKAKLFIAKEKSLEEWKELMERLRQLFFGELTKKGYHLLGLTKDQSHLYEYFSKKQEILEAYFTILDWSFG